MNIEEFDGQQILQTPLPKKAKKLIPTINQSQERYRNSENNNPFSSKLPTERKRQKALHDQANSCHAKFNETKTRILTQAQTGNKTNLKQLQNTFTKLDKLASIQQNMTKGIVSTAKTVLSNTKSGIRRRAERESLFTHDSDDRYSKGSSDTPRTRYKNEQISLQMQKDKQQMQI